MWTRTASLTPRSAPALARLVLLALLVSRVVPAAPSSSRALAPAIYPPDVPTMFSASFTYTVDGLTVVQTGYRGDHGVVSWQPLVEFGAWRIDTHWPIGNSTSVVAVFRNGTRKEFSFFSSGGDAHDAHGAHDAHDAHEAVSGCSSSAVDSGYPAIDYDWLSSESEGVHFVDYEVVHNTSTQHWASEECVDAWIAVDALLFGTPVRLTTRGSPHLLPNGSIECPGPTAVYTYTSFARLPPSQSEVGAPLFAEPAACEPSHPASPSPTPSPGAAGPPAWVWSTVAAAVALMVGGLVGFRLGRRGQEGEPGTRRARFSSSLLDSM